MHLRLAAPLLALVLLVPHPAPAQVMASEHATVSQRVDGTIITVEYYRPQRRGRDHVIGNVVKWGSTWTPGANWATTIEVNRDVHIDGQAVPKGKYSIWMIPQPDQWTVILSSAWKRFHVQGPDSTASQIRFTVKPEQGPVTDVLTFTFPAVDKDTATLLLQWDTAAVPLHIDVPPSNSLAPTG